MIDFKKYGWLEKLDGLPLMIQEGIRIGKLNTSEISGSKTNPEILKIAKTAGTVKLGMSSKYVKRCVYASVSYRDSGVGRYRNG